MTDSEYDRMVDEERLATISQLEADLAAARAVLDLSGSGTGFGNRMIVVDDAKWQAWQARGKKEQA